MAAEKSNKLGTYYRGYAKFIVLGRAFYLLKPMFVENIFIWVNQQELQKLNVLDDPEALKTDGEISLENPGIRQQLESWFMQDEAIKQLVTELGNTFDALFSWIEQIEVFDLAVLTHKEGIQLKAGLRLIFKDQADEAGNLQSGIGLNDFFRIKEFEVVVYQTAGKFTQTELDAMVQMAYSDLQAFMEEENIVAHYREVMEQNTRLERFS